MPDDILLKLLISQVREEALFNALDVAIAELERTLLLDGDHELTVDTLEKIYDISMGASAVIASLVYEESELEETVH